MVFISYLLTYKFLFAQSSVAPATKKRKSGDEDEMEDDYEPKTKGRKSTRGNSAAVANKKAKTGKWAPDNVLENPKGVLSKIDVKVCNHVAIIMRLSLIRKSGYSNESPRLVKPYQRRAR